MSKKTYTVREASHILGCSTDWVSKFCRTYKERYEIHKFGSEWVITEKIIEAIKNNQGKVGRPKK